MQAHGFQLVEFFARGAKKAGSFDLVFLLHGQDSDLQPSVNHHARQFHFPFVFIYRLADESALVSKDTLSTTILLTVS